MKTFIAATLATASLAQFDFGSFGDDLASGFEDLGGDILDMAGDAGDFLGDMFTPVEGEKTTISTVPATATTRAGTMTFWNTCTGTLCKWIADQSGGVVEGTSGFRKGTWSFYMSLVDPATNDIWELKMGLHDTLSFVPALVKGNTTDLAKFESNPATYMGTDWWVQLCMLSLVEPCGVDADGLGAVSAEMAIDWVNDGSEGAEFYRKVGETAQIGVMHGYWGSSSNKFGTPVTYVDLTLLAGATTLATATAAGVLLAGLTF